MFSVPVPDLVVPVPGTSKEEHGTQPRPPNGRRAALPAAKFDAKRCARTEGLVLSP